ncbi:MAG: hypothetical protein H0V90_04880 [Blastocatellia bacterium]|nr:hypothetical protein [Blastocatellia bacterium]
MKIIERKETRDSAVNGRNAHRLICITAAQRSGTTALQFALEAAGLKIFSEVFHTAPLNDGAGSFVRFAREHNVRLCETTTRAEVVKIADSYLGWIRELSASRHIVIDVKLNSWPVLSPWWRYPHQEPFFLTHLKRQKAVLIFIWRENLADQLLSQLIACEFGIWHNLTAEKTAGRTLTAPLGRLKELAGWVTRAEVELLDHLRDYPLKIVLRYEDLFTPNDLSDTFRQRFAEVAEIDLPKRTLMPVRPNTVPKRSIVTNYDEITSALAPFASWRRVEWEKRTRFKGDLHLDLPYFGAFDCAV